MKQFCNFYNRIDRVYLKSSDKYINRQIEGSKLNSRFMCRRILFNSRLAIWFVFVPICSRERDKLAHRGDCWCQYRDSGMTSYGESKSRKDVKEWRRVMEPLGMPGSPSTRLIGCQFLASASKFYASLVCNNRNRVTCGDKNQCCKKEWNANDNLFSLFP